MVSGLSLFLSGLDFGQKIFGGGVLKICSVKYMKSDFNKVAKQLFLFGFYVMNILDSQCSRGREELHRLSDISWVIATQTSPLHIGSSWTRTGNLRFPNERC